MNVKYKIVQWWMVAVLLTVTKLDLQAQVNITSVHPLFLGELNGDSIRKNYAHTNTSVYGDVEYVMVNGRKEVPVSLEIFHSNNIFLGTGLNITDRLPEIEKFGKEPVSAYQILSKRKLSEVSGYYLHRAVPVFDSIGVIVLASGIHRDNAHLYEFRVLENRSKVVVDWHPITLFSGSYIQRFINGIEEEEVAYLGEFKTSFGNGLTIEVRSKDSREFLTSFSALWVNRYPTLLATFSNNNMKAFLSVFKYQWKNDFSRGQGTYYGDQGSEPIDSLLKIDSSFDSDETSIIFYLSDKIKSKESVEYNLVTGNDSTGWVKNDFDLNLVWLKNLSAGNHILRMRYSFQPANVRSFSFHVAAPWQQGWLFRGLLGAALVLLIGAIVFIAYTRRQRRKLIQEESQKEQVQMELKSIRSQFNPHFVFNALGSIQGLITKNDMEGANKYLTRFSTLLRDSLKESSREMVSLATELKMLDTYLSLEKLRFGFEYKMEMDAVIVPNDVELPVLLLQPIVENAVKHGISGLYENGLLVLSFNKRGRDLVIDVSDNGKGFDTSLQSEGYGIKMTRERIALINKTLSNQSIEMQIASKKTGTTISLNFSNWWT